VHLVGLRGVPKTLIGAPGSESRKLGALCYGVLSNITRTGTKGRVLTLNPGRPCTVSSPAVAGVGVGVG
jgi:hypothetical protein